MTDSITQARFIDRDRGEEWLCALVMLPHTGDVVEIYEAQEIHPLVTHRVTSVEHQVAPNTHRIVVYVTRTIRIAWR